MNSAILAPIPYELVVILYKNFKFEYILQLSIVH